MHSDYLDYKDGANTCEAYVAYNDANDAKRPCVLISHAWGGQSDGERTNADKLAQMGYLAFALDNYGKGRRGSTMEENSKLMQPFIDDRKMLLSRLLAGVSAASAHPMVDATRIAAIGYCFGGLCVLDLARSADPRIRGVVSFHGLFNPPNIGKQKEISAKVLILHGYDDPMATPENMVAVAKELTDAGADWQIHAYGHALHAFSNPGANMPENGILYDEKAARRSWEAMRYFLAEVFN
ncbi:MAG: dienelactone hydrolase family protein [Candidatus Obscuribacterales bacterium]|nr:dienelactone hydrolase family protein [Candidatus Obscuribacterales bacterium]